METRTKPVARMELEKLEKAYRITNRTVRTVVLTLLFALMIGLAFALYGTRNDQHRYTTDVTPIHVEISPVNSRTKTAQDPRNVQL